MPFLLAVVRLLVTYFKATSTHFQSQHTHKHSLYTFSSKSFQHRLIDRSQWNSSHPSGGVWLNNLCSMFVPVCQGLLFHVNTGLLLLLWSECLFSLPGPPSKQWWRGQLLAQGDYPFQGHHRGASIMCRSEVSLFFCLCLPITLYIWRNAVASAVWPL